jgi:hypothetical protein
MSHIILGNRNKLHLRRAGVEFTASSNMRSATKEDALLSHRFNHHRDAGADNTIRRRTSAELAAEDQTRRFFKGNLIAAGSWEHQRLDGNRDHLGNPQALTDIDIVQIANLDTIHGNDIAINLEFVS